MPLLFALRTNIDIEINLSSFPAHLIIHELLSDLYGGRRPHAVVAPPGCAPRPVEVVIFPPFTPRCAVAHWSHGVLRSLSLCPSHSFVPSTAVGQMNVLACLLSEISIISVGLVTPGIFTTLATSLMTLLAMEEFAPLMTLLCIACDGPLPARINFFDELGSAVLSYTSSLTLITPLPPYPRLRRLTLDEIAQIMTSAGLLESSSLLPSVTTSASRDATNTLPEPLPTGMGSGIVREPRVMRVVGRYLCSSAFNVVLSLFVLVHR